jgi:hypothetical protein
MIYHIRVAELTRVLYTFNVITFLNQQVESFKRNHKKIELVILNLAAKKVYDCNINAFNFNVEVGGGWGRRFFSK